MTKLPLSLFKRLKWTSLPVAGRQSRFFPLNQHSKSTVLLIFLLLPFSLQACDERPIGHPERLCKVLHSSSMRKLADITAAEIDQAIDEAAREADRQYGFENIGRVPERSKGADCNSVADSFVGSNPTPTIKQIDTVICRDNVIVTGLCAFGGHRWSDEAIEHLHLKTDRVDTISANCIQSYSSIDYSTWHFMCDFCNVKRDQQSTITICDTIYKEKECEHRLMGLSSKSNKDTGEFYKGCFHCDLTVKVSVFDLDEDDLKWLGLYVEPSEIFDSFICDTIYEETDQTAVKPCRININRMSCCKLCDLTTPAQYEKLIDLIEPCRNGHDYGPAPYVIRHGNECLYCGTETYYQTFNKCIQGEYDRLLGKVK